MANFVRDVPGRVMIPAYARPAHKRLRARLAEMGAWNDKDGPNVVVEQAGKGLGIITSGIAFQHVCEAEPTAKVLKIGLTYPLPIETMRAFAASVDRCLIVEEGDPFLYEAARTAGIAVENKPEMYRFGELNVDRVRRIVTRDTSPEAVSPPGKPPELCPGCPHRNVFEALHELDCIVAWRHRLLHAPACYRRSRPWTPASAWALPSASAWGCATRCRPSKPVAW